MSGLVWNVLVCVDVILDALKLARIIMVTTKDHVQIGVHLLDGAGLV